MESTNISTDPVPSMSNDPTLENTARNTQDATFFPDGEVITQTWHPVFVVFAFAIAFVSSYTAVHLLDHDIWRTEKEKKHAIIQCPRVVAATILGAGTVWCMHFVGMAAVSLDRTPTCFAWPKTMGSLAASVSFMIIAIMVASTDVFATEDRVQVLKQVVLHKRNGMTRRSSRDRRRNSRLAMREVASAVCFQQLHPLMIAAVVAAAGAMIMHYTGMMAMRGPFRKEWNIVLVMISAVVAIFICFVGLWVIFRLRWKFQELWPRYVSAAIIATAICGLHFFGMMGVTYIADSHAENLCLHTLERSQASPDEWETHQVVVVGICLLVPSIAVFVENIINQELTLAHGSKKDVEFSKFIKRVKKKPKAVSEESQVVTDDDVLEDTGSCSGNNEEEDEEEEDEDLSAVEKELRMRLEKNNSSASVNSGGLSCDYGTPDTSKQDETKPESHPDASLPASAANTHYIRSQL